MFSASDVERKTIKRIMGAVLVALFCCYTAGVTLFPHTHVINGVIITHSHPYTGSPDNPGHSHTTLQFETIGHLSTVLLVLTAVLGILGLFRTLARVVRSGHTLRPIAAPSDVYRLRGPPYC